MSKVKVPAGWLHSEHLRGLQVPPSSRVLTWSSLRMCLCRNLFVLGPRSQWTCAHPNEGRVYLSHSSQGPVSKYSHVLRYGCEDSTYKSAGGAGDITQPIPGIIPFLCRDVNFAFEVLVSY